MCCYHSRVYMQAQVSVAIISCTLELDVCVISMGLSILRQSTVNISGVDIMSMINTSTGLYWDNEARSVTNSAHKYMSKLTVVYQKRIITFSRMRAT